MAKLGLLHNNSYALALITDLQGKPIWHHGLTRDTGGTWGILADVNGDGLREFIHAQPDGLIRCFDASAPRSLCMTCPRDATAASHTAPAGDPSRWLIDLRAPISRVVAADLDADGRHDLVFGGSDGNLYALAERSGQARVLWRIPLGRRVGEPDSGRPRRRWPC